MEKYQTPQLEAASKILEILGLPCPHTLEEKIKTIEASKIVLGSRVEDPAKNYCIAMQEVANAIKAGRIVQESLVGQATQAANLVRWASYPSHKIG